MITITPPHTFSRVLDVNSQDHPILISETPLLPKSHRERLCQVLFETYNVPGLYIASSPALSLYSGGRTTGAVLDVGERVTTVAPVVDGYLATHACETLPLGGHDITVRFDTLLAPRNQELFTGMGMNDAVRLEIVQEAKERHALVVANPEQQLAVLHKMVSKKQQMQQQQVQQQVQQQKKGASGSQQQSQQQQQSLADKIYELPDGNRLVIGPQERFMCTEVLFSPFETLGLELDGIHKQLFHSVFRCSIEQRKELFNNIVITGGTSLLPGFQSRVQQEIEQMVPTQFQPANVIASKERRFGAWMGGSIVAQLPSMQQMWIRKRDYNEHGPQIINRKTFA